VKRGGGRERGGERGREGGSYLIPDANGVIGRACREPAAIEIILCIQNVVVVARVHDFLELYGWVQTRGRGEACRAG